MQLKSFKSFVHQVIREGIRLQKLDIAGNRTTSNRFTTMQILSFVVASISTILLNTGFSDNFAGFVIGFLGIFIGLFASIIVSSFDRSKDILEVSETIDQLERVRMTKVRNHLVQFNGLTSYSIILAIFIILLLALVLLHPIFKLDIFEYKLIQSWKALIQIRPILTFFGISILVFHRFLVIFLLINFFSITVYSLSSYFSFLQSQYKQPKSK